MLSSKLQNNPHLNPLLFFNLLLTHTHTPTQARTHANASHCLAVRRIEIYGKDTSKQGGKSWSLTCAGWDSSSSVRYVQTLHHVSESVKAVSCKIRKDMMGAVQTRVQWCKNDVGLPTGASLQSRGGESDAVRWVIPPNILIKWARKRLQCLTPTVKLSPLETRVTVNEHRFVLSDPLSHLRCDRISTWWNTWGRFRTDLFIDALSVLAQASKSGHNN